MLHCATLSQCKRNPEIHGTPPGRSSASKKGRCFAASAAKRCAGTGAVLRTSRPGFGAAPSRPCGVRGLAGPGTYFICAYIICFTYACTYFICFTYVCSTSRKNSWRRSLAGGRGRARRTDGEVGLRPLAARRRPPRTKYFAGAAQRRRWTGWQCPAVDEKAGDSSSSEISLGFVIFRDSSSSLGIYRGLLRMGPPWEDAPHRRLERRRQVNDVTSVGGAVALPRRAVPRCSSRRKGPNAHTPTFIYAHTQFVCGKD